MVRSSTADAHRQRGAGAKLRALLCAVSALLMMVARPGHGQAQGNVLFREDFATFSNRWSMLASPKASVQRATNHLSVRVESPGVFAWSTPDFVPPVASHRVETTVTLPNGDAQAGLVFGYRDDGNFMAWLVAGDGSWRLWRRTDGQWRDRTPPVERTIPVQPGQGRVTLAVEITGAWHFYIDGTLTGTVRSPGGEGLGDGFGVVARAGRGYAAVLFDEVLVTEIREGGPS